MTRKLSGARMKAPWPYSTRSPSTAPPLNSTMNQCRSKEPYNGSPPQSNPRPLSGGTTPKTRVTVQSATAVNVAQTALKTAFVILTLIVTWRISRGLPSWKALWGWPSCRTRSASASWLTLRFSWTRTTKTKAPFLAPNATWMKSKKRSSFDTGEYW